MKTSDCAGKLSISLGIYHHYEHRTQERYGSLLCVGFDFEKRLVRH